MIGRTHAPRTQRGPTGRSESFVVNVDLEGSPYRVRLSDMSAQPAFQQRLWSPRVGADGQDRDVQVPAPGRSGGIQYGRMQVQEGIDQNAFT